MRSEGLYLWAVHYLCTQYFILLYFQYYIALDWAIMRFHQERMRVINRNIRELWRATYRGNDIDYIEIDTEDGSDLSMAGADKRKTVNYRVVMVKNETKLVLSIVIRK